MLKDFKIPELGENVSSGVVSKVMVKIGETVKADQAVIELESEKATLEVPISFGGVVKEILIQPGQQAKVGQVVLKIETETSATKEQSQPKTESPKTGDKSVGAIHESPLPIPKQTTIPIQQPVSQPSAPAKDIAAAPSVRRFAREIGIDVNQVPGTGTKGRVSIEDVKSFAKQLNSGLMRAGQPEGGQALVPLPDFSKWGEIERKPMSMIRQKTAKHLSHAWVTIPHVTQFDKADITDLENLRKRYAQRVEKLGGKLTITPFLIKVIVSALKNFPQFNSSIDMGRNEIVQKQYYNVGVAVDTDRGLLVPVIKNADKKNIIELAVELTQIAEKARTKKTTIDEMQGGTFTITNLGGIGGTFFTPIVNSPEVAILGVSRANMEPSYSGNICAPRLMLPLSLSYDHRVIDGADGARFLKWVTEAIQQPFLMDLEK